MTVSLSYIYMYIYIGFVFMCCVCVYSTCSTPHYNRTYALLLRLPGAQLQVNTLGAATALRPRIAAAQRRPGAGGIYLRHAATAAPGQPQAIATNHQQYAIQTPNGIVP